MGTLVRTPKPNTMSTSLLSVGTLAKSIRAQTSLAQTCQYCAKRMASKARSKRPPSLEIELLKSIPNLGSPGQRVVVAPGYMRNHLYPKRLAMYVVRGRAMALDGQLRAKPTSIGSALSGSNPFELAADAHAPATSERAKQRESAALLELTQAQLADELARLPTLVFARRTAGKTALHGSVSPQDIVSRLQELGVQVTELDGAFVPAGARAQKGAKADEGGIEKGRIKSVGEYIFNVKLQKVTAPVRVKVEAEQTTSA